MPGKRRDSGWRGYLENVLYFSLLLFFVGCLGALVRGASSGGLHISWHNLFLAALFSVAFAFLAPLVVWSTFRIPLWLGLAKRKPRRRGK
jgi:hypothetical protein